MFQITYECFVQVYGRKKRQVKGKNNLMRVNTQACEAQKDNVKFSHKKQKGVPELKLVFILVKIEYLSLTSNFPRQAKE